MTRIIALPHANFHSSEGWVQINMEQSFQNVEKMIDKKSAIQFLSHFLRQWEEMASILKVITLASGNIWET